MTELTVPFVTCDHCPGTVAETPKFVAHSTVEIDLIARLVEIQSSQDRADQVEAHAQELVRENGALVVSAIERLR